MNYELVSIDGIIQGANAYTVLNGFIRFKNAPPAGSAVNIRNNLLNVTYEGNGTQVVFDMPITEEVKYKLFMTKVWENRDNPTVKDQIEKLKIVMELIR
jgi:hypothetical protein